LGVKGQATQPGNRAVGNTLTTSSKLALNIRQRLPVGIVENARQLCWRGNIHPRKLQFSVLVAARRTGARWLLPSDHFIGRAPCIQIAAQSALPAGAINLALGRAAQYTGNIAPHPDALLRLAGLPVPASVKAINAFRNRSQLILPLGEKLQRRSKHWLLHRHSCSKRGLQKPLRFWRSAHE